MTFVRAEKYTWSAAAAEDAQDRKPIAAATAREEPGCEATARSTSADFRVLALVHAAVKRVVCFASSGEFATAVPADLSTTANREGWPSRRAESPETAREVNRFRSRLLEVDFPV